MSEQAQQPDRLAQQWGIAGNAGAIGTLAASVAAGRVSHAYLITGPLGVGRTTLALALARALNCESAPAERPCGVCDACRRIARGAHPDVTLIDMAWQEAMIERPRGNDRSRARQRLSIDAVRHLRQDIVTRPVMGRWKVQIVDDAAMLTDEASDAYLKTLEEPPPFAVIVLVAESVDALPETVRSRCRHIALGPIARDEITAALVQRGIEQQTAEKIARLARGRMAWAIAASRDATLLTKRREAVEQAFERMTEPLGRVEIISDMAQKHSRQRDRTFDALDLWTGLWRDALLLKLGLDEQTAYPEVAERLVSATAQAGPADLYRALWATQRCMQDLAANVQARIALQAMVMQWPR